MAYFTNEVNRSVAKPPLNFNGGLGKFRLNLLNQTWITFLSKKKISWWLTRWKQICHDANIVVTFRTEDCHVPMTKVLVLPGLKF